MVGLQRLPDCARVVVAVRKGDKTAEGGGPVAGGGGFRSPARPGGRADGCAVSCHGVCSVAMAKRCVGDHVLVDCIMKHRSHVTLKKSPRGWVRATQWRVELNLGSCSK